MAWPACCLVAVGVILRSNSRALHLRGFANRVLDFDANAADVYGDIVVARERAGRPLEGFDGLIAAIARSHGLPIATRDIDDFEGCGIEVINPWGAILSEP